MSLKIIKENGCWEIPNTPEPNGYVRIRVDHKLIQIHRISAWYYHKLDLDNKNLLALHKNECNNRKCWNPEHLYIGTYSDNLRDTIENGYVGIGEFQKKKKYCPQGHEYTPENTKIHRFGRLCKQCNRNRANKHYQLKKANGTRLVN